MNEILNLLTMYNNRGRKISVRLVATLESRLETGLSLICPSSHRINNFGKHLYPCDETRKTVMPMFAPTHLIKLSLTADDLEETWEVQQNDSMFDAIFVVSTKQA